MISTLPESMWVKYIFNRWVEAECCNSFPPSQNTPSSSKEQFSNGVTICSLYLNQLPNSKSPPIDHSIFQVMKEASLLYCLPTTPLQSFFQTGILSGNKFDGFYSFLSTRDRSHLHKTLSLYKFSARSNLWIYWMDLLPALFESSWQWV